MQRSGLKAEGCDVLAWQQKTEFALAAGRRCYHPARVGSGGVAGHVVAPAIVYPSRAEPHQQ